MIFQNEILLGGAVAKVMRNDDKRIARIWVNVPQGDETDERDKDKAVTIPVDVTDDTQYTQTEVLKEGDYFSCVAALVNRKVQPDGKDKKFSIRFAVAIPSQPLVMIPDGGKYAPRAFNRIALQGRTQRIGELKDTKGGKSKMIFLTVAFSPKMPKNATDDEKREAVVYADVAFFGGTAEKYIKPYLKEKDIILVTGSLAMYEEDWKVKDKAVSSVRINARDAKFATPVDFDGGGKRKSDTPDTKKYDEKDLPF